MNLQVFDGACNLSGTLSGKSFLKGDRIGIEPFVGIMRAEDTVCVVGGGHWRLKQRRFIVDLDMVPF